MLGRKHLAIAAKAVLTVGLLVLLAPHIDASRLVGLLIEPTTLGGILIATAALALQSGLGAIRQIELLSLFEEKVTFGQSLAIWVTGLFVSQVLVTFIAGDVARALQFVKAGLPRRLAGRAVLLDRAIGLVVLLGMVMMIMPFILPLTGGHLVLRSSLLILTGCCLAGIVAFLASGFLQRIAAWLPWEFLKHRVIDILLDLMSVSRFLHNAPSSGTRIALLSAAMHLLNSVAIVVLALMMGVTASPWLIGAISLPVMLLTMLPISLAGWGVREAAMVTGLGLLDVPPDVALSISVSFGLSMLLVSLPGLPVLLYGKAAQSIGA